MPIYEYRCEKCGTFEATQRITDKPIGKCPTCKAKVKKLISHTSFQLKGSGWYITDYARKGKSADGKSDEAAKPAAETKSDSKSDSKKSESSSKSGDKSSTTSSSTASA